MGINNLSDVRLAEILVLVFAWWPDGYTAGRGEQELGSVQETSEDPIIAGHTAAATRPGLWTLSCWIRVKCHQQCYVRFVLMSM